LAKKSILKELLILFPIRHSWDDESLGRDFYEVEIPDEFQSQVNQYRKLLIEGAAEESDDLLEKYISNPELITEKKFVQGSKATLENRITPVFCGSSFKNKGVQLLIDAIVAYLPSPLIWQKFRPIL
jgi:elongation factor G